ncbi:hypothetical protein L2E82_27769 [Cichorium intybus]|uniref:Uncharacterized protein n=1 Tax=Cichorium intybus TaxID=13427 RepID=A0ACB9CUJ1_CICIN|nr:hypothetical protein L2E82_27769 [Cichorium intybus]
MPSFPLLLGPFELIGGCVVSENTMFTSKSLQLGAQAIEGLSKVSRFSKSALPVTITQRKSYIQGRELFSTTPTDNADKVNEETQKISVTFVDKDGEEKQIKVPIGMSMLEAAHQNDIELEGACEGSLACSTCHVIVMDVEQYNKLEEPTDEENDMLDLAFGLTETSRLGCQVIAKPELDGLRLALPAATRNFAVDGFKPKPH